MSRINVTCFGMFLLFLQCESFHSFPSSRRVNFNFGSNRPKFSRGRGPSNPLLASAPLSDNCPAVEEPFVSGKEYFITAHGNEGCAEPNLYLNGVLLQDDKIRSGVIRVLYEGDVVAATASATLDGNYNADCRWITFHVIKYSNSQLVYMAGISSSVRAEYQVYVDGNSWLSPSFDGCGWQPAQTDPASPDYCYRAWAVPLFGEGYEAAFFRIVMGKPC